MLQSMKRFLVATAILLAGTTMVAAACPAPLAGSTPEVLAANQQRLICLQRELEADAAFRAQDARLRALQQQLATQDLQRRFDRLPRYEPPRF
jgi:hypothetical protein